jgi:Response regulator containing a CheY-like receiver domain and an HD-GYP domain
MKYKILAVDDEAANVRMLERVFRPQFDVVTALSGAEALDLLAVHDIALIISDQRMPGMTGVEFLKRAAEMRPRCVRFILTGYTDANDLADALNSNVIYKYITKPWIAEDLLQTVKQGLAHFETIKEHHLLNLENTRLNDRLSAAEEGILRILTRMLHLKSADAVDHAARVRDMAEQIGREMHFDAAEMRQLSHAAYLHEIADLTELEMLTGSPGVEEIIPTLRYLTEHFDGSGSPEGLAGERIPLNSRIIAVVNAFDELTFAPPSKKNYTNEDAKTTLSLASGKQFDPNIVSIFIEMRSSTQIPNMTLDNSPSIRL